MTTELDYKMTVSEAKQMLAFVTQRATELVTELATVRCQKLKLEMFIKQAGGGAAINPPTQQPTLPTDTSFKVEHSPTGKAKKGQTTPAVMNFLRLEAATGRFGSTTAQISDAVGASKAVVSKCLTALVKQNVVERDGSHYRLKS